MLKLCHSEGHFTAQARKYSNVFFVIAIVFVLSQPEAFADSNAQTSTPQCQNLFVNEAKSDISIPAKISRFFKNWKINRIDSKISNPFQSDLIAKLKDLNLLDLSSEALQVENEYQYKIFLKAIEKIKSGREISYIFWDNLFRTDLDSFQYDLLNVLIDYGRLNSLTYQNFEALLNYRLESKEFSKYLVNKLLNSGSSLNYSRERIQWRLSHYDLANLNQRSVDTILNYFAFNRNERIMKILASRYSKRNELLPYIEALYMNYGKLTEVILPSQVKLGVHFVKRQSTLYVNIPYVFAPETALGQRPGHLDLHFSQALYTIIAAASRNLVIDSSIKSINFVAQAVVNNDFISTLTNMGFKFNPNPNLSDYPRNAAQAVFNVVPGKFFELRVIKKSY